MDEAEEFLNEHIPRIYSEVPEVTREIFARFPFGREFTLSNGRKGRIKTFFDPQEDEGRWKFGFDVVFDEGSPDHLEFLVIHTGVGGFVSEPPMDAVEEVLNEHIPGIYGEVPEVMREIFARFPFGQEFTLSNGRKGRIKTFVEPSNEAGTWAFGFDVVFDEGSPDHLKFWVAHTGGGGFVQEPVKPIAKSGHA
jgi:hypothetical protein